MRNAVVMKSLFIAIAMLLFANSANSEQQNLEEFFGGDELHIFDLCELINDMKLAEAVSDNDLGLVRQYIINKNTYATNLYYTLASQQKLDWDEVDELTFYVADAVKNGIKEGFFTSDEIMQMENQCIDRYLVRSFPLDLQIDGLNRMEFQIELNQTFFKYYGLISN